MSEKIPVGILGATGVVGQRFIQIARASSLVRSGVAGCFRPLRGTGLRRRRALAPEDADTGARAQDDRSRTLSPDGAPRVIFAALDAGIAREMEPQFAAAGCAVVSNSSAFRMQEDVPLVIPEVNADHLALIEKQSWRKQSGGYIVTNPNCSAIGLVIALAPLHRKFGIESLFVTTMQAVSGAGYPGVASLDILGNVIPYIAEGRREDGRGDA